MTLPDKFEGVSMTKEVAERVMQLSVEQEKIFDEMYSIRGKLTTNGAGTWENVKTAALKFLSENKKEATK